jgi:hypothetical protein
MAPTGYLQIGGFEEITTAVHPAPDQLDDGVVVLRRAALKDLATLLASDCRKPLKLPTVKTTEVLNLVDSCLTGPTSTVSCFSRSAKPDLTPGMGVAFTLVRRDEPEAFLRGRHDGLSLAPSG